MRQVRHYTVQYIWSLLRASQKQQELLNCDSQIDPSSKIDGCLQLTPRNPPDHLFRKRIITCDEKCIFFYNPSVYKQSLSKS